MGNRFLFIILTIFFYFSCNSLPQDQSKLMEISSKIQKLVMQMQNTRDQAERERIQKEVESLTNEYFEEAEKVEREIQPMLKEFENSLPPALQEIYKLERQLDDLKPETDMDKINDISNQIIDKMGKIYSGKISVDTELTSFITSTKFCKKGQLTCEIEGSAIQPDFYDVNYKMIVNMDMVWVADYVVDILQKKGYLIAYTIDTYASETEPEEIRFPKLSGTKNIIRLNQPVTRGPIDKYKLEPGFGYFQIAPTDLKIFNIEDVQSWPDEMVNEYTISLIPPHILFYSSMDDVTLSPWAPYPHTKISDNISPNELNEGIQKGEYSKTITLNDPPGPALKTTLKFHLLFQSLICDEKGNIGAMAVSGACIDHGGYILATDDLVYIDGKPVARVGDNVLCFRHGVTEIIGDKNVEVYSEKQRVARVGDKTKCGAVILGGSRNIYVGDKKK